MTWNPGDAVESPDTARIAALETAVADLQRRVAALESSAATTAQSPYGSVAPADAAQDPWSVPPWPEVVELLRGRRKIEAIKVYREHFGGGLAQAKDAIEEVERRLG